MMKKNPSNSHQPLTDQTITATGLFSSKQSKQRVLQQLKRGTLFRWSRKKEPQANHAFSRCGGEEQKSWLFDIKIGLENQFDESPNKPFQGEYKKKVRDKLPNILKHKTSPIQSHTAAIEKRCDKITCLTKKLSKIGAWKDQNSKNIDKNISKLEKSLHLDECSLIQDDFWKIEGAESIQDKSLQSSLIFLDKSSIIQNTSEFNPFMNFPNFSQTLGQWKQSKQKYKENKRKKQNDQPQQGSFIPNFLMSSLVVQNQKKLTIK